MSRSECTCGHAKSLHDDEYGCCVSQCECWDYEPQYELTKAAARREALQSAAALIQYTEFTTHEGKRLSESDPATHRAWTVLQAARMDVARSLAKRAGVSLDDLCWFSEDG